MDKPSRKLTATQQARRYRKTLKRIADLPDAECWWSIARTMCDLIADDETLSVAEAERRAIDQYDREHSQGAYADQFQMPGRSR